jgi:hypothetical protein
MPTNHRGEEVGGNSQASPRSNKNSGPTCIDCGDRATHYFESELYHDPGKGEHYCASCASEFD